MFNISFSCMAIWFLLKLYKVLMVGIQIKESLLQPTIQI